jgi:hypothetical protein
MSNSEIGISVLKLLNEREAKSSATLLSEMHDKGFVVSASEIFDIMIQAESSGLVKRVKTEIFDEAKPVITSSWILTRKFENPREARNPINLDSYIEDAKIVVSQPIFLTMQGLDLRSLGVPVLNVREAMEKIVMDAKKEIRIACPYYDELFIDVLSAHAQNVSNLQSVAVLAETMDPILLKACSLFSNTKVKTLFKGITGSSGSNLKVQGIHAKLMIADKSEVLLGSFNFRFSHIYYNVDLGLLAKGKIADHYARIYDLIWGSKP